MIPTELHAIIQHDASERSDQINSISANMVERRIRCTSIPAGSCARENREECKYCRMNDLIATRREGAEEGAELPPELLAAIQQDDYERSWRRNHATTTTAMQTIALQGETQTTQRCTCEDCLRGGCCVGFAGGGPCTFIGTCNDCIRFRTCIGVVNGGPCIREEIAVPMQGQQGLKEKRRQASR